MQLPPYRLLHVRVQVARDMCEPLCPLTTNSSGVPAGFQGNNSKFMQDRQRPIELHTKHVDVFNSPLSCASLGVY
jgi:hypothetical protein